MTEPLDFTATFEFRRRGTTTVVGTGKSSGTFTPSVPVVPAPAGPLGSRVKVGAYVNDGRSGDPWDPTPHLDLEKRLGRQLAPVSSFIGWDVDLTQVPVRAYGSRDHLISWHPDQVQNVDEILTGKWDTYLNRFAASVDTFSTASGATVYIRLMPEMNGSWARWSAANGALGITSPAKYIEVYRYVADKVSRRTNKVNWVWCPNITDDPGQSGNRLEEYWPGSTFVQVLGFDGYNWGDSGNGAQHWTSFTDLVNLPQGGANRSIYDRLTALHPTLPVWVCEFACKDPSKDDGQPSGLSPANPSQSKAQWYTDLLRTPGVPRLTTLVCFDVAKERDWRLTSSPGVVEAIATQLTTKTSDSNGRQT